jgi:hypothetical protein
VELQLHYDYTLRVLEKKMRAYKEAFLEQREVRRRQDKTLKEYDYVIECMNKRRAAPPGRDQQAAEKTNNIYEQLLMRIKAEYEKELSELRNCPTPFKDERSLSPVTPTVQGK